MQDGRDHWYHDLMKDASPNCEPEQMESEDPLFILYTSGSTGKPKGTAHHRRLHGICKHNLQVYLRLSGRRCILVHC